MPTHQSKGPLQLGDRAPNVVLDAVTRDGKVSLDDFRGHKPVLVGSGISEAELRRLLREFFVRKEILHAGEERAVADEFARSAAAISRPWRTSTRRSATWGSKVLPS